MRNIPNQAENQEVAPGVPDAIGKPITPDKIVALYAATIPGVVFDSFNKLIATNWDGRQAVVRQDEVVGAIAERLDLSRSDVFKKHYLDVESLYEAVGWQVVYDKPGYNESYPPTFTFSRKNTR